MTGLEVRAAEIYVCCADARVLVYDLRAGRLTVQQIADTGTPRPLISLHK